MEKNVFLYKRAIDLLESIEDEALKDIIRKGIISYMDEEPQTEPIDTRPIELRDKDIREFRKHMLTADEIKEAIDRKCIALEYPKECIKAWERANKLYAVFNDKLFSGQLPDVNIFIDITCGSRECTAEYEYGLNILYPDLKSKHNIRITEDITEEELPEALLHEMVHEYCKIHGIKDAYFNGSTCVHTKEYADTAREHGYIVDNEEYGTGHINPIYKLNI